MTCNGWHNSIFLHANVFSLKSLKHFHTFICISVRNYNNLLITNRNLSLRRTTSIYCTLHRNKCFLLFHGWQRNLYKSKNSSSSYSKMILMSFSDGVPPQSQNALKTVSNIKIYLSDNDNMTQNKEYCLYSFSECEIGKGRYGQNGSKSVILNLLLTYIFSLLKPIGLQDGTYYHEL